MSDVNPSATLTALFCCLPRYEGVGTYSRHIAACGQAVVQSIEERPQVDSPAAAAHKDEGMTVRQLGGRRCCCASAFGESVGLVGDEYDPGDTGGR
jgi:hypothetical protein